MNSFKKNSHKKKKCVGVCEREGERKRDKRER